MHNKKYNLLYVILTVRYHFLAVAEFLWPTNDIAFPICRFQVSRRVAQHEQRASLQFVSGRHATVRSPSLYESGIQFNHEQALERNEKRNSAQYVLSAPK